MRLSISTNMENELLDGLIGTNVIQVFGKLSNDYVGGGLESHLLNSKTSSKEHFEQHVKYVHEKGMTYNYTFNAPSLMNREYTKEGRKKIRELLDYICMIGVDEVTVANYYLMSLILKSYPNLDVKVSATMQVDTIKQCKIFEDMGVSCIVLDPMKVNRDFQLLEAIRKAVKCDLELIVNNNCLWKCPVLQPHQTFLGHSSQSKESTDLDFDYIYVKRCAQDRVNKPESWLIADWIRPEDLYLYEEIGYDYFKIIDRATPTDIMIMRAKAYTNRKYDGNLLDLIQHWGYRDIASPTEYIDNIYIDNRKLDNYVNHFKRKNCALLECGTECRHCFVYAEKCVNINPDFQLNYNKNHAILISKSERVE